jgi:hypothetical protein
MNFPTYWQDDCPPADAIDAAGKVYRVVKADPPTLDDFATHFETGRLPKASACLRCGLSVFREVQDAIHLKKLFPKIGKWVAEGDLYPSHGKTKLTSGKQPTHTTWWVYENVDRRQPFSVIEENE